MYMVLCASVTVETSKVRWVGIAQVVGAREMCGGGCGVMGRGDGWCVMWWVEMMGGVRG